MLDLNHRQIELDGGFALGIPSKFLVQNIGYELAAFYRSNQRGLSRWFRKKLHRRSHLEATIGHMKNEGKLGRNWLKGIEGDAINAVLCGVGQNMRLLLAAIVFLPQGSLY